MLKPTVIDFFCGAGGFSEGFRQQGFEILYGIDNWEPAIKTFNHNFGLDLKPKNVLDFEASIDEILQLPNTTVILGSPPCVSFSNSNKSGKADKSMGLRLTEAFLRVVAIKKFQPDSQLEGWLMENVSNSLKYIKKYYSFHDLNLSDWARSIGKDPKSIAITINGNSAIINSADYGSPQIRKRAITGEIIKANGLIIPKETHRSPKKKGNIPTYRTLGEIRKSLPSPFNFQYKKFVIDPTYDIKIRMEDLSDHFYDTGLYECEWKNSEYLKTNHPYMGRMSFPENENNPSRTICATNIGTSRESIIYRSEFLRFGDGEFRTHTVREAATIMCFPINYQFLGGGESSKCRLVGNAVCPSVSHAFAKTVRESLNLKPIDIPITNKSINTKGVVDLNDYKGKEFKDPPKKKEGSRFRRHPFKHGNITVTLSNYDIINGNMDGKWITSVQYGKGKGFPNNTYPDNFYIKLKSLISALKQGKSFLETINNGFTEKIAPADILQLMHEEQRSMEGFLEPKKLIEDICAIIENLEIKENYIQDKNEVFYQKQVIPVKQIFALYAINRITSIANRK